MKIINLSPQYENLYFCCLEDWSDEIKEAGNHKACWYAKMKHKGLRVKLAQDDNGSIGGMIQYLPAEVSHIDGKDVYVVLCIWVHGHKSGRGNYQKRGMGKALLKAAEEDVRELGAKGLVAWGLWLPFFMRASWFKKQGYKVVDKLGMMRLLLKEFTPVTSMPCFIRQNKKPVLYPGKLAISLFKNGWCTAQNMVYERTKRAMAGFEHKIVLHEYDTSDLLIQQEWGICDAIFIDHAELRTGPPPAYKKIRKLVERKVKRYR